jgi:hypothetical protein
MVACRLYKVRVPGNDVVEQLAQEGVGAFESWIGEVVFDNLAKAGDRRLASALRVCRCAVTEMLVYVKVPEAAGTARGGPDCAGVPVANGAYTSGMRL